MRRQNVTVIAGSVQRLLRRDAHGHIANLLGKLRPADVSGIMMELSERERNAVFSTLLDSDRQLAADTLKVLGPESGRDLLAGRSPQKISEIIQELETDSATVFVSALPEELAQQVLAEMDSEESGDVLELLQYEKKTAGRLMTPHVFSLREDLSVTEAIHTIQTTEDLEMVFYLYVVDARNHLVGVVSLRKLLVVPPATPLKKLMDTDVISVPTDLDQEDVAARVALYDLLAVPVVDEEHKLVGVITVDDVIDVIKEEATEDILYLAGVEADDHVHTPALTSVKKRLPWLMVNLGTALLAATVVAFYEPTIARFSYLAVFLPVVAGMGGNSGTQTLTVIIRALALGEVAWDNGRSVLAKEVMVSICNGLLIGILAGAIAYLWKGNYLLGLVLGASMMINLLVAGVVGTLIPLTLNRLNVDPAIASGIFVTTFTDAIGFLSFLGLAGMLLHSLLPG